MAENESRCPTLFILFCYSWILLGSGLIGFLSRTLANLVIKANLGVLSWSDQAPACTK